MIPYSPTQLLFFFFVYCFFGWIIESTWVSLHQKKFVNRGFMHGPFIPIYGFGAMALLIVGTLLVKWPVAVFFGGMLAASVLEYITGVVMEAVFKVRYWDYSNKKFNINGHVCLFNSLCWGLLSCLLVYFIHKPVAALSEWLTYKSLNLLVMVISVYFVSDLTLSFKAAFDMRDLIIKMDKAREEMRIMQKRLDVMLAYANADRQEFMDEHFDRAEDLARSLDAKFDAVRAAMEEKPSEFADSVRDEFKDLRERFAENKASHFGLTGFKDIYKRGLIKGNPSMVSKKFKDSLDAVKEYVNKKNDK